MSKETTTPQVYAAIANVMAALSSEGISKTKTNSQQNYKFRGIDDVYNALAPVLAKEKLLILPRVLSRIEEERETKSGGQLAYVTVHMEFDLVSGLDGSKHTVSTYGEAMDSADKATNKAMSAAFKYAAFQAFCIPTEGHEDADQTTYEVAPKAKAATNGSDPKKAKAAEIMQRMGISSAQSAVLKTYCERLGQPLSGFLVDMDAAAKATTYDALLAELKAAIDAKAAREAEEAQTLELAIAGEEK